MNRRGFIGSILAAAGSLVCPVLALASPSILEKARRRLLPGVWATFGGTGIESDIYVDETYRGLNIYAGEWKSGLGFVITEKSIIDGTYIEIVKKTLPVLKELALEEHNWKKWHGDAYVSQHRRV